MKSDSTLEAQPIKQKPAELMFCAEGSEQFEIQKIPLPKNFLRKLVGYQDKALQYFRLSQNYDFNFYFNEKLLVDDVYPMDYLTNLRI